MYKAYCDSHLLLSFNVEEYKLVNPVIELELNKTGSFKFTIYPNHPNYDKLKKLKSIITVYQDDKLIFRGRILNDVLGFHNEKQVTCEGELAFLLDSIQRPYDFISGSKHTTIKALFKYFINNHNAQVGASHQFKVGNITVTDGNDYIVKSDSTYLNTWDSINKKLIESFGGYLQVRHEADGNYIDYISEFDKISNQEIEFGQNLLDISRTAKGEDIATAIIPLGAKKKDKQGNETEFRVTIDNSGKDYVYDQDAVNAFGWIFKTVVFDDVTDKNILKTKGNAELGASISILNSIEVNAVDLAAINKDINAFHLGTYVKVVSAPHNLNSNFLVNKLSINLLNPSSNKLTLGKSYKSLTEIKQKELKEVSSTSVTYQTSTSGTIIPEGEWLDTIPKTSESKPYLWTRTITTYTDDSTATSYSVSSTIDGIIIGSSNMLDDSLLLQGFKAIEPIRDEDDVWIEDETNEKIYD